MSHTPGPWWYDADTDHGSPIIFAGPKPQPFEGYRRLNYINHDPVVAFHQADYDSEAWFEVEDEDGYLLAAAAELLEAAILADDALGREYSANDEDTRGGVALRALRSAIRKAKGETE